jgi:hypothetical protein
MNARGLFAIALLLGSAAHAQTVSVEKAPCIPREDNGLVRATITGEAPGQSARLYFRWRNDGNGDKAFYWLPLEAEPNGRYWATPPKPEKRNARVEYYAALVDPAGKVVARSETQLSPVTGDCKVQLGPKERGVAENLTVGETSPDQQGREVLAFLCDGIVTRINHAGIRRADDVCRVCVVAWWKKGAVLPAAALVGVIVTDDDPEPSPSRP